MTLQELRYVNRTIKAETHRFCRGLVPSMDEIGDLAWMTACKTYNMLSAPAKVNFNGWKEIVGNSIMRIISEEI